jgi:hypothetical protein
MTLLTQPSNFRWTKSPPGPWTPAQITTALWLDAADAATITTISGAVSQWDDKSGNSRNVSQSTASFRPTYPSNILNGLPAVRFDGTDDRLQTASAFFTTRALAMYVVARNRNLTGDSTLAGQELATNNNRYIFFTSSSTANRIMLLLCDSSSTTLSGTPTSSFYIYEYEQSGSIVSLRANGDTATTNSSQSTTNLASTPLVFGAQRTDGGGFGAVDIGEVVCLPSQPSDAVRQRVEGYLAHKWGLTGNLPAGHPYKTSPPYISY